MKDGNERARFKRQQIQDFRCGTDDRFIVHENPVGINRDRKIAILPGADKDYRGMFLLKKFEIVVGEWRMTVILFVFF